jgi:hypothetical protein
MGVTLSLASDNCPELYPKEHLITELKHQLLARLEYWKGAARKFAREIREGWAAQKREEQDINETVNPLGVFGSFTTATQSTDRRVLRRRHQNGDIEKVRSLARKMLAEGATHHEVCQRLQDADRPPRSEWRHLPWDKAYMNERYRGSVCKWLSKNCRP